MAIQSLKDELSTIFKREIQGLAVNHLHANKVEGLLFKHDKIVEYYEWVIDTIQNNYGLTITGGTAEAAATRMMTELARKANTSPEPIHVSHKTGEYLKIVYLVAGGQRSYFHEVTAKNGKTKPQGAMRTKVQQAKVHGREIFGIENSLSTSQKGTLTGGLDGHHGGTTTPSQSTSRRILLPEEYTGKMGGTNAKVTDFHSTGAKRTTKGMLKGKDVVLSKLGGKRFTVDDLFDETDADTADGMLSTVFLTSLADWFDVNLGWDRTPRVKELSSTSRNPNKIELNNLIFVEFALGKGSGSRIGAAYTDAMKEWDAGKYNKLNATIAKVLDNIEIKIIERIMAGTEKNAFRLVEMKGSPSFADKIDVEGKRLVVANLFGHKTTPNMKYKVNKQIFALAKGTKLSKAKARKDEKIKGIGTKMRGNMALPPVKRRSQRGTSRVQARAGSNPLALRNMLNEILPVAIAGNMTSPALNYRTGRFANSVRVTNVTQGPRGGGTMIEATYMTSPYDTFAPGGDKYTPQRNPERLIRRTLREVATGVVGKKFGVNIR